MTKKYVLHDLWVAGHPHPEKSLEICVSLKTGEKTAEQGSFVGESFSKLRETVEAAYPGVFENDDWNAAVLAVVGSIKEELDEIITRFQGENWDCAMWELVSLPNRLSEEIMEMAQSWN